MTTLTIIYLLCGAAFCTIGLSDLLHDSQMRARYRTAMVFFLSIIVIAVWPLFLAIAVYGVVLNYMYKGEE